MTWSDMWNTVDGVRALGDRLQYTAIALVAFGALCQLAKQAAVVRERALSAKAAAQKERDFVGGIGRAQENAKRAGERAAIAAEQARQAGALATRDIPRDPAAALAESTRLALTEWRAKHPHVAVVVNVLGTGAPGMSHAAENVASALTAAGIETKGGMMVGMYASTEAVPHGPVVAAPKDLHPAASDLCQSLSGLTPEAWLQAEPSTDANTISLTFRGTPNFAPDGAVIFR